MPAEAVAVEASGIAANTSTESVSSGKQDNSAEVSGQSTDAGADEQTTGTETAEKDVQGQQPTKGDLRSVLKDPAKREALKALDPSLPGLLRDALHGRETLMREFPGGLNEAIDFKKIVHEMGGREGLQEVRETADDYSALDELYTEGKPEFVQKIAEGDPDAFQRMVPAAVEQFAQMAPEAYQNMMARVLINTFDGVGLSNALRGHLSASAGRNQRAGIKEILDYVESFRSIAAKVPEKKVDPERQKLETEKQTFAQQKAQEVSRAVDRESIQHRDSIIAREIKPFGDWGTMDPDRRGAVAAWISQRIGKTLQADRGFMDRRTRLIASGDRDGLARLEQGKLDEMVPRLVPQAAKVFGVSAAAKVQPKEAAKPTQAAAKPPQGWSQVKSAPNPSNIDRRKTSADMIFKNQAILTDGRRVQWA